MGVGMPEDLMMIWENGVDMSDCIIPTKFARGGTFLPIVEKLELLIKIIGVIFFR
jgi:tRNA-guanine family transglycosylase